MTLEHPANFYGIIEVLQSIQDLVGSGALGTADGDYGDITISAGGTVYTINPDTISTLKIEDGAVTSPKLADDLDLVRPKATTNPAWLDDSLKLISSSFLRDEFEPFGLYQRSGVQTAANSVWTTFVANSVVYGASYYNTTTGVLTIPASKTGMYLLMADLQVLPTYAGSNYRWYVGSGYRVNGGTDVVMTFHHREDASGDNNGLYGYASWVRPVYLNAGDTIEFRFYGYGNAGATVYANNASQAYCSIMKIPLAGFV